MTKDSLPQTGWNGSGWLRLRLNVAPALVDVLLNLETAHLGASEIYLDGKLIKRYGSIGNAAATEDPYNPNAEPFAIAFDDAGEHLLAVRYSNQAAADFNSGYGKWLLGRETTRYSNIGFQSRLRRFGDTVNQGWKVNFSFTYIIIQAAVFFSFGVLHLLLFTLYPQQRGDLFYSPFLFGTALNDLCLSLFTIVHYGTVGTYRLFHLAEDGTLTIAVGDATGHGLKAGTVVTATKSLFNNLASAPDISTALKRISQALKGMNLRGLFMALTMLKIKGNRLLIGAAGMPSTLIYRYTIGKIEEIKLRALPLGSLAKIEYKEQEYTLALNDCVILMSDGFTEMFNEADEMLGDSEVRRVFAEAAKLSPQEIIDRFITVGEKWAGSRPPDDDITFVVLKMKNAYD